MFKPEPSWISLTTTQQAEIQPFALTAGWQMLSHQSIPTLFPQRFRKKLDSAVVISAPTSSGGTWLVFTCRPSGREGRSGTFCDHRAFFWSGPLRNVLASRQVGWPKPDAPTWPLGTCRLYQRPGWRRSRPTDPWRSRRNPSLGWAKRRSPPLAPAGYGGRRPPAPRYPTSNELRRPCVQLVVTEAAGAGSAPLGLLLHWHTHRSRGSIPVQPHAPRWTRSTCGPHA